MAGLSLALLIALCAIPSLLGDRVREALSGLDAARTDWLWVAALAFVGTAVSGALCWRSALRASGTTLPYADATARYCVGSGVNALAPAHIGSALRVALFGRVTTGGCWTVGGAAAAVGVTRVVWLVALIALGSAGGILPIWPLFALGGAAVGGTAAALVARRRLSLPARVEQTLEAFEALIASPETSRSSVPGRSSAHSPRSERQLPSSPPSASTIRSVPHSSSSPPSLWPRRCPSPPATSAWQAQPLPSS